MTHHDALRLALREFFTPKNGTSPVWVFDEQCAESPTLCDVLQYGIDRDWFSMTSNEARKQLHVRLNRKGQEELFDV